MTVHTHVCYRGQEFVVAVSVCALAYVSVFECASTCGAVHVCLRTHTHVCCNSEEFVVMPRLAVTF